MISELRGEHAIIGNGRTAALDVPQDGRARLDSGAILNLTGNASTDPAEANRLWAGRIEMSDHLFAIGRQSAILLSFLMLGVVGAILVLAGPIAGFFIADPAVAVLGAKILRWFAVAQFFSALSLCLQGALNGAGDTQPAMRYMLITQWGVMLPVAYALVAYADWIPEGPLLAWVLAPILSFALTLRRFRSGRWKALRV